MEQFIFILLIGLSLISMFGGIHLMFTSINFSTAIERWMGALSGAMMFAASLFGIVVAYTYVP